MSISEKALAKQKDIVKGQEPKILYWDLETSPILGWTWTGYNVDRILGIEQHTKILAVGHRWEGESKTHVKGLDDFKGYKPDRFNIDDEQIIAYIWGLLDDADVIIAQNGDKFDSRMANARFLHYGLKPPSPYIQIDTLKIAKKYFKLPFYSLDELLKYVGLKGKVSTGGMQLWFDCMDGDPKAWKKMKKYCKNDVELLPQIYDLMKGWHKTHPNLSFFTRIDKECPTCLSDNIIKRGKRWVRTGYRQEYSCKDCGSWFRGQILKDDIEKVKTY